MTSSLDRLLAVGTEGGALEVVRGKKHKHPAGWEPGLDTSRGVLITEPLEKAPSDWDAVLRELLPEGMDPAEFDIDGSTVEVRAWDGNVGMGEIKRFYYFKARVRRRNALAEGYDLDDIVRVAKKTRVRQPQAGGEDRTYWIQATDFQAGQGDGDGVAGQVARALELAQLVKDDLAALKKGGKPCGSIFVPITGDLVEGVLGWYAMQTFSVQLDRRDQVKLVRRILTEFLTDIASTGLPVHVAVVPGNHGENRNDGKAYTSLNDNDDVAIVEQIAEAFRLAGLDTVTFSLPQRDRLHLTVEVQGWVVGLTHGHAARAGSGTEGKILNWFKSMAASRDPIGDADILFTGHYHHARFQQLIGDTEWVQGGALCDTSAWFSQTFGLTTDPVVMKGTITKQQRLESVMPYRWARTKPQQRELLDGPNT